MNNLANNRREKVNKRVFYLYGILIGICVLAIIVVVGVQVLGNDVVDNMFGINKITKRSEEEESKLKANFEDMINNTTTNKSENGGIIYTKYEKKSKNGNIEINVNIPCINIKNNDVEKFNKEMTDTFQKKAEEIISSEQNNSNNIVYTVKYKGYMENNILSLIVYSDLKQGNSAQRVIMLTFNYDMKQNKQLKLEEAINEYGLRKNEVQNKINNDIKEEQRKADELKELGYNVFSRNLKSDIYKIDKISEFFIYDGNIYIIFAYGNESITSQRDIVII